jgi:hypothetical protein
VRASLVLGVLIVYLVCVVSCPAQSPSGTISGLVVDPSGAVIADADIVIVNDETRVQYSGKTNSEGLYVLANLPPGTYRLQVSKIGFKTIIKPDIVLNVQDAIAITFTLPIGAVSEIVTIQAGAPLVNTENGAVSTVVDHNLIESLPLNGRSFNTLLQLTPGVVIAPSSGGGEGQFSIAGQRTSSNNFEIDGVSANFGVSPNAGTQSSGTGSTQAFSALGGTSSLVSVEALQEFRIETSSFAPEFGRAPGGQVLLTTRPGTNDLHGGVYEYFRNDVLDANDWFANSAGEPRAAERHNDFGAYLGGPIVRDKTFFFLSYEGVRLRQPNTTVVEVPSMYARSVAGSSVAPFLDAYPQPDDKAITPGVYAEPFTGNYSNPSTLNAGSVRIDQSFGSKLAVFGRYNEAPSDTAPRNNNLAEVDVTTVNTRTLTLNAVFAPKATVSNSFRFNYSQQRAGLVSHLDNFGGAVPPANSVLAPGLTSGLENDSLQFITFDTSFFQTGPSSRNRSRQINVADDVSVNRGTHLLKFGFDYRGITLHVNPFSSAVLYIASDVQSLLTTGQALLFTQTVAPASLLAHSASLFAQDTWKLTSRLTITYGVRWELSPAPAAQDGTDLAAWRNIDQPANLSLAPSGASLWTTTYTNFAPRAGIAYALTPKGDFVLRGGWGMFYDLASAATGALAANFPNNIPNCCAAITIPVANITPFLPALTDQPPYPDGVKGFDPNLRLPRSYQWNVALEKSFLGSQALSVTYVGQAGRNLLKQIGIAQPNANFTGTFLVTENRAVSNYDALQVQYRRPLAKSVQALFSYSYSHSLDDASNEILPVLSSAVLSGGHDYASSSFDVRHSFSGALVMQLPSAGKWKPLTLLTKEWALNTLVVARSGFPFNASVETETISGANPRPNLVPGQPVWIANPSAGGGKSLNPNAFVPAPPGQQGTEGRNDIPGFGLTQIDLSLVRKFALSDRVHLQFRTDAFNVLNHPNFQNPFAFIGLGPTFLSSPSMLNNGLGGLNPLFQQGGPRSLQLSLKLTF